MLIPDDLKPTPEPSRLLHCPGEGNIDYYPPLVFVTLYREYSREEHLRMAERLAELFPGHPLLIQDRSVRPYAAVAHRGDIPREMTVAENGLDYYINPLRGQNPGFFIDMREGRRRVGEIVRSWPDSEPGRVLNLFAYTCSFSVAALAAGASRVVNIDMNRNSLDIGKRNHRLNHSRIPGGFGTQALFLPHDIFKSFGKLRKEGPYSLIIADPPPSQKGSFDLKRDYPRLLRRLPEMLTPDGRLLLTLNSPECNWEDFEVLAKEELPLFDFNRITPPEDFAPREKGRGLKILLSR